MHLIINDRGFLFVKCSFIYHLDSTNKQKLVVKASFLSTVHVSSFKCINVLRITKDTYHCTPSMPFLRRSLGGGGRSVGGSNIGGRKLSGNG